MGATMTIPPRANETEAVRHYESMYAQDSLGFVRWLMSETATDEMVAARQVLARESEKRA